MFIQNAQQMEIGDHGDRGARATVGHSENTKPVVVMILPQLWVVRNVKATRLFQKAVQMMNAMDSVQVGQALLSALTAKLHALVFPKVFVIIRTARTVALVRREI